MPYPDHIRHNKKRPRTWVIHPRIVLCTYTRPAKVALAESNALVHALPDLDWQGGTIVQLRKVHPSKFFGTGKTRELKDVFIDQAIDLVVISGVITPIQQRTLETAWGVKILDRTALILEIFSHRARSREGTLQVNLAALRYQRTRLVRSWTHLERQRGALGFVGGPGETQIESDRRAIDKAIGRIEHNLRTVRQTRTIQRRARTRVPYPIVALVGYTNTGKSTLFTVLTGAKVPARNRLFETLDPTMRQMTLANKQRVIVSDTVGFISDLPTQLVAAFRATLEEVVNANAIVHVHDASAQEQQHQADNVRSVLNDIGVPQATPILDVWNKIDALPINQRMDLCTECANDNAHWDTKDNNTPPQLAISALHGWGIDGVMRCIEQCVGGAQSCATVHVAFADIAQRAWLRARGVIVSEQQTQHGFTLCVQWSEKQAGQFYKCFAQKEQTGQPQRVICH